MVYIAPKGPKVLSAISTVSEESSITTPSSTHRQACRSPVLPQTTTTKTTTITTTTTTTTTTTSTTTVTSSPTLSPVKAQDCHTSHKKLKGKRHESPVSTLEPSSPVDSPRAMRREFFNPLYYIPLPEDLVAPPPGKYKDFYCVTAGQECGIFCTWNETNARVKGISGATYQRYNSWPEAYDSYVKAYRQGIVSATPIANGPFDPCVEGDEADLADAFTRLIV